MALTSSGRSDCATPLTCPVVDPEVVLRPLVIDALGSREARVVVVTAPGGYGKTSHVAAWASRDPRSLLWITVETLDNDPHVFLTRLAEQLAAVTDVESSRLPVPGLLPLQYATVGASRLGRALANTRTPFVLALDDVHLIESEASIDLLDALVATVPRGSELVLIGRGVRLDTLTRLQTNPDVREITLDDLAIGVEEAALIFERLGLQPSEDLVERTVKEAEGWPVGVRLAGLRLARRDGSDATEMLELPIAHERAIADYVWSQWLAEATDDDVDFLMRASVLSQMSGPVCDHVLQRRDSAQVLRRIHRDRFAVVPLARHRDSYRLHRLLHDVLVAELQHAHPDVERRLHLRASRWFDAAGDADAAVHHALAAGDLAHAERLVTTALPRFYSAGRGLTVQRWLEAFPRAFVQNRPPLCVAAGMTALGQGDGDGAVAWLRFGEHAVERVGEAAGPVERAVLATFRSMVRRDTVDACLEDAVAGCRVLPPGTWHAGASIVRGSLSWMKNDLETAAAALVDAAAEARACDAPSVEAMALGRLALVYLSRGEMTDARLHAADARRVQREHHLEEMPTLHIVPAVTALLAALDGRPDVARDESRRSRRNLSYFDGVSPWVSVPTRIVLAETSLLLCDRPNAQHLLDEARQLLEVQPDAILALEKVKKLVEQLNDSDASLATGRFALTTAELRVLHYLPTNLRIPEIASRLYVSRFTVKTQASSIYRKLGAANRTEAVALACDAGLLQIDDARTP